MQKPIDDALLARYLSNECSPEEQAAVEAWMNAEPQNQTMMKLLKIAWNTAEAQSQPTDIQRLWANVEKQTGLKNGINSPAVNTASTASSKIFKWPFRAYADNYIRLLRYVAIIILAVALPYFVTKLIVYQQKSDMKTVVVAYGEQSQLTLDDGTSITLDAGSRLDYPAKFTGTTREVFLQGEGYFNVTPNAEQPFIVRAQHAVVTVRGTQFNVRAWQEQPQVAVVVADGEVAFRADQSDRRQEVIIASGQMSVLPQQGQPSAPQAVDVNQYLAWLEHEIYFQDATLQEVITQLERWYDLEISIADQSILNEHVTIHITQKSTADVLELVSALIGLDFEQNGKVVRFN